MRPIPRPRHLTAVLIFAAVAAATAYLASLDDQMSGPQVNIATAAIKRHSPGTFGHDPVYGEGKLWQFHTPAYQSLLELTLVPTDYQDLRLPFRAMAGVMAMIYLCGMYALLYAQTRSWSVSAFAAVLSARVVEVLGGGVWGVGSLASITPTGLVLAVLPLVMLAFLRHSRPQRDQEVPAQWRLLLVFGAVGLLGNFHLVTAMNVTIVLLIAYVARQRFSPRCVPMALGCGLAALVAASPYAGYYFSLRARMGQLDPQPLAATLYQALRIGHLVTFYPELLKSMLEWQWLVGALVLVAPAVAVLARVERYRTQNLDVWIWLIVGSLFTALGLHAASQYIGQALGTGPPVIDFLQASSLVLGPLYVLLAQAITNLFRMFRNHRHLLRWLCVALMVGWMLPSDNLRMARRTAAAAATAFMAEADKPSYVLRHAEQHARHAELEAIAHWAAGRNGSIYLTDQSIFRVLSGRPILVGPEDARYFYYLTPGRLDEWISRSARQDQLLHPRIGRADGAALRQFVADLTAHDQNLTDLAEWYVVLPAAVAPAKPGSLTAVEDPAWGKHYRLYRIR